MTDYNPTPYERRSVFCSNPKCQYHVAFKDNRRTSSEFPDYTSKYGDKRILINRHIASITRTDITGHFSHTAFWLCDTCFNVYQMVKP